jgi:hypothetical protein
MNLYRVEAFAYVPAVGKDDAISKFTNNIGLAMVRVEDTGEGIPDECRIVDDCPAGDWTCPYWYEGGCTLENCREECDEWYGLDE